MRKLEAIYWVDPTTHAGWYTPEEAAALKLDGCISVGHIISEDDGLVKMVTSFCEASNSMGDVSVIPIGLVTRREHIADLDI